MQITKFEYTDAKGKVTQRTVAVLRKPSPVVEAIDVSELTNEDVHVFASQYNEALDRFKKEMAALQDEFDLTFNLRNFKPENMTNQESFYA